MRTKATQAVLAALLLGLGLTVGGTRAEAGGMDWLYPVSDRYEPGETATVVGYTVRSTESDPDVLDWSDTGPFHGYLRVDPGVSTGGDPEPPWLPVVHPTDVDLGEPSVVASAHGDVEYRAVRVSLSFPVPTDLAPGPYEVFLCEPNCTTTLGYVGGATVYVGVNPPQPVVRHWPLDEPAIADLAADALVWYGFHPEPLTAAQVRAGDLPLSRDTPTAITTAADPVESDDQDAADTTPAEPADEDVATGPPTAPGDGSDVGGVVPWLIAFAVLVGLWCAAWRIGNGKDRPPRKRVTRNSTVSTATDEPSDLASGHPMRIRL